MYSSATISPSPTKSKMRRVDEIQHIHDAKQHIHDAKRLRECSPEECENGQGLIYYDPEGECEKITHFFESWPSGTFP